MTEDMSGLESKDTLQDYADKHNGRLPVHEDQNHRQDEIEDRGSYSLEQLKYIKDVVDGKD